MYVARQTNRIDSANSSEIFSFLRSYSDETIFENYSFGEIRIFRRRFFLGRIFFSSIFGRGYSVHYFLKRG